MTHQLPLLHSGTQRNHKDFSSDVPSNAVFGVASDAKLFWKIMVVVVVGPSLILRKISGLCVLEALQRPFHPTKCCPSAVKKVVRFPP